MIYNLYVIQIKIYMRYIFFIIFLSLIFSQSAISQNASTYFPGNTGYEWFFETRTLDSLNNPIQSSLRYRRDVYNNDETYIGRQAKIVHVRDFLSDPSGSGPITDTLRYSFEGTNGFEYVDILGSLDSIPFIGKLGITNFLNSLSGWYSLYRFASNVNTEYTLFSRDTTVSFDTVSLPLRFSLKAKRMADQTLNTVAGTFTAKRFVQINTVSFLLIINPLPPIEIPIVRQFDTTWYATDKWLLRRSVPSTNVDLSGLGFPISFYIPGSVMTLTNPSTITQTSNEVPSGFELSQNYPNPFNPSTTINFNIPESGIVRLIVYDMLGREVATLINEQMQAGSYSYNFEAMGLNSGTYVYKLEAGDVSISRKMILVK